MRVVSFVYMFEFCMRVLSLYTCTEFCMRVLSFVCVNFNLYTCLYLWATVRGTLADGLQ